MSAQDGSPSDQADDDDDDDDDGPRLLHEFEADVEDSGRALERFLVRSLDCAPDHAHKLVRQGRVQVSVEGWPPRTAEPGETLLGGEFVLVLSRGGSLPPPQPNRKLKLTVLHEDPALVVVDKFAGVATHPGPGHGTDTLLNALVARFPDLLELGAERGYGLVHRLDLGTSGVLAVARTPEAYETLTEAFAEREVEKRYLALTVGAPQPAADVIDLPVGNKDSRTRYKTLETRWKTALVELFPQTGRTHQLRIHLAARRAPILGDKRYGSGRDEITQRLYLTRLALHAAQLTLTHPTSGERVSWESKFPKALAKAWRRAEKQ